MAIKIIALSGAHGLIGSQLKKKLEEQDYEVWPLVRSKGRLGPRQIAYDYQSNFIEADKLKMCDAVIHLAGKNILSGIWTPRVKKEIFESRVLSTQLIAKTIIEHGPRVFLCASAVGFYGDSGEKEVDEHAKPGKGFLSTLCQAWEKATASARLAGVRVVNLRFGIVISPRGGMLKQIIPLFKFGLGGRLGAGHQYMSLVDLDDVISAIIFALSEKKMEGPVNVVAPESVTNNEFTRMLGEKFNRSNWLSLPTWFLKSLGEQSTLLLSSTRAVPQKLIDHGFRFSCMNLCEMFKKL
ncbi:MAG: TIGR01777 family oxidoreductase [Myxococcales bacterium]|nr:TIGR01777 family oxidoreductase [Myxococcales bacterium]USN49962.1 MAG: TIGR01777 family protein [Myxococcales bacterium]